MGLDNLIYERKPVQDERLSKALEPLCGGSFMTNDNNSFRGKVYNELLETITGLSLYNSSEWSLASLDECVDSLTEFIEENKDDWDNKVSQPDERYIGSFTSLEEVIALRDVFKLCSEEGWLIEAWY